LSFFYLFDFHLVVVLCLGLPLLKAAVGILNYEKTEEINYLVRFIGLLGRETLTVGLKKMNVANVALCIANLAGINDMFRVSIESNRISDLLPISWFISFVVINDITLKNKFRPLFDLLMDKITNKDAKKQLQLAFGVTTATIKEGKTKSKAVSLDELKNSEPLHDNDFLEDFRKISILPTVDEINCFDYPLDHIPNCCLDSDEKESTESVDSLQEYPLLDRQFRLLREDMLSPLREELKKILSSTNPKDFMKQKLFSPIAFDIGTFPSCFVKIAFKPPPNLEKKLEKLKNQKKKIKSFFKEEASKLLARDSLLIFVDVGMKKAVHVGLVTYRKEDEMAETWINHKMLSVGVYFPDNSLKSILLNLQDLPAPTTDVATMSNSFSSFVIQSKISYFAYEPVLKCLKCKTMFSCLFSLLFF
jgi:hypothetical protein